MAVRTSLPGRGAGGYGERAECREQESRWDRKRDGAHPEQQCGELASLVGHEITGGHW